MSQNDYNHVLSPVDYLSIKTTIEWPIGVHYRQCTYPLTWGVERPEPVGDVSSLSRDSFDIDFSNPSLLTEVNLGGGRGKSSTPSPLLQKLVGLDLLGESEGVRILPPLRVGTTGGLSGFYRINNKRIIDQ